MKWGQCRHLVSGRQDQTIKCAADETEERLIIVEASKDQKKAKISINFDLLTDAIASKPPKSDFSVVYLEMASNCVEASILERMNSVRCCTADKYLTIQEIIVEVIKGAAKVFDHDCSALCEDISRQWGGDESDTNGGSSSHLVMDVQDQGESFEMVFDKVFLGITSCFEAIDWKFTEPGVEVVVDLSKVTISMPWQGMLSSRITVRLEGINEAHFFLVPFADQPPDTDSMSICFPQEQSSHFIKTLKSTLTDLFRTRAAGLHLDPHPTKSLGEEYIVLALSLLMMLLRGDMCLCGGSRSPDREDSCDGKGLCRFRLHALHPESDHVKSDSVGCLAVTLSLAAVLTFVHCVGWICSSACLG